MSIYAKETQNFSVILILISCLISSQRLVGAILSDKRLCADENCSQIISLGTTVLTYQAGENGMVSFKINTPVRIKSKSAGLNPELWGIEVNGREGYAPKSSIREIKVYIPDSKLTHIVDVKSKQNGNSESLQFQSQSSQSEKIVENLVDKKIALSQINKSDNVAIASSVSNNSENVADQDIKLNKINVTNTNASNNIIHENVTSSDGETEELKPAAIAFDNQDMSAKEIQEDIKQNKTEDITNTTDINVIKDEQTIVNESKNLDSPNVQIKNEIDIKNLETKLPFIGKTEEPKANVLPPLVENLKYNAKVNHLLNLTSNEMVKDQIHQNNDSDIYTNQFLENRTINNNHSNDTIANNTHVPELITMTTEVPSLEHNKEVENNKISELNTNKTLESDKNDDDKDDEDEEEDENDETEDDDDDDDDDEEIEGDNDNAAEFVETVNNNKLPNEYKNDFIVNQQQHQQQHQQQQEQRHQHQLQQQPLPQIQEKNVINNYKENSSRMKDHNSTGENALDIDIETPTDKHYEAASTEIPYGTITSSIPLPNTQTSSNQSIDDNIPSEVITETSTQTTITTSSITYNNKNVKKDDKIAIHLSDKSETKSDEMLSSTDLPSDVIHTDSIEVFSTVEQKQEISMSDENDIELQHTNVNDQNVLKEVDIPTTIASPVDSIAVSSKMLSDTNEKLLPEMLPKEKGLFATILGAVNNIWTADKNSLAKQDESELRNIPYLVKENNEKQIQQQQYEVDSNIDTNLNLYCEKLGPNDCPRSQSQQLHMEKCDCDSTRQSTFIPLDVNWSQFTERLMSNLLDKSDLLACLLVTAAATLTFIFGYYCFCNSSREGALLSKLNQLESTLLASYKENAILKHNLVSTKQKLASIEDNSFSSNDMVTSLKKELEEELVQKDHLQNQIANLQKELENAADAGIELNRIVSELLSNQTGDESILSSVEELQKQLNEQQNTILEINASLAEKSRENSELQLMLAEQSAQYESKINNLQRDNDELEVEKSNLLGRIDELRNDFDRDMMAALESKNFEIKRLQNEIMELQCQLENERTKWQTSLAKVEALEDCLKSIKRDPNVNMNQIIDSASVKAEMLDAQKQLKTLKEKHDIELEARKSIENQLKLTSHEVETLKKDFNQAEKDKLEAQTRLEVLSNYFKEKETQLQKELSLKEAMWLKQQGETTTTVDRLTAMQDEIQSLKSQNDSLRAEMEAQIAAYKAQMGTLENRAHETWLAARQADRRYEEARTEAFALRRQLTALAAGGVSGANAGIGAGAPTGTGTINDMQNNKLITGDERPAIPSPVHIEAPSSPILGHMPPPPPFMGPPLPFMGMPPPPLPPLSFVPTGEIRPAPLGRIMSPPPLSSQHTSSGRFTPPADYDDYLHFDDWPRHPQRYSPPPRTYRSLSPSDSRYERDLISTYDTDTDFSPSQSPRITTTRDMRKYRNSNDHSTRNSNYTNNIHNTNKNSTINKNDNKGNLSSDSEKSLNCLTHQYHHHHYQQEQQPHHHHHSHTKAKGSNSGSKSFV